MSAEDDVIVTDTLQISVTYSDGEVSANNDIWWHSLTGAITPTRRRDAAVAVHMWHKTNVMPFLTAEAHTFDAIAVDRSVTSLAVSSSFPQVQVSGGFDPAVPFVCVLRIDFNTAGFGPWYKGRNFVSGLPRSQVVKSHINASWAESVRATYDLLPALAASLDFEWVVVSRRLAGAARTTGVTTPITSVTLPDLRVRTYRQRIARFGT